MTPKPELIEVSLTSINGAYVESEGRTFIVINKDLPQRERRCTLAHEMGHYHNSSLINHVEPRSEYERTLNQRVEHRANRWAAEHLIPQRDLEQYLDKHETAMAHDLADYFDVTEEVAAFRMELYRRQNDRIRLLP